MNERTSYDGVWRKRLHALSEVWPDFLAGNTSALHKTRVASRRIREALPVAGASAPPAKVRKLRRTMKALTSRLGPIRELDVELAMLEAESAGEGAPRSALALVRREIASQRHALRRKLKRDRPVGDLKKLLKKLQRVGHLRKPRHETAWRAALAAAMLRRAKKLKTALDEAGPLYAPERIHGVRITTKKLRYVLEILADSGNAEVRPLIKMLKREQDRLGRLHDVQMLLEHVRQAESSPRVGSRLAELNAYADSLENECRRLHAEFVEHRDRMFDGVQKVRGELVPALASRDLRPASARAPRDAKVRRAQAQRQGR